LASITCQQESPNQPDVRALIEALDRYLQELYPVESNHLLGIERLLHSDIRFVVARQNGVALGCGALRIDAEGYGEVKRLFVTPDARGLGLGERLVIELERIARNESLQCLRLETGIHQHAALAVFRKLGFSERSPFGEYRMDRLSRFMEKALGAEGASA